jgi:hypothetical protein
LVKLRNSASALTVAPISMACTRAGTMPNGDQTRSRASQTMEDISHASWDDAEEKDKF